MVTAADAFPSKYLKATDLMDGPVVVTIKLAELETIKGFDGKSQPKVIVYFSKKYKPLVLNRTNFDSIADIANSGETEDWPGTKVELFVIPVTFNGKTSDGIRIRKPGAEQKPKKAAAPQAADTKPDYNDEIPFLAESEAE
jgi:hypothetical protein